MSLDHPPDSSAPPTLPPSLPERYKVIRHLGSGAMGRVYEVMDQTRDEAVALKVIPTETAEDRRRVEREITTHGKLHHESIVRLYDVGASDNAVFFTMELLAGRTLADFANAPPPDLDETRWLVSVTSKLLEALGHVHSKGFLHRDLKPSNVVIVATDPESSVEDAHIDEDPVVKLLDFGLARQRSAPTLSGSGPGGTPLYMSPEQLQASVALDERSDLYSVGAILYHLLTRTPPYTRLPQVLTTTPPRDRFPKACPRRLVDLVYRLLAKERHLRPASAKEAREEALAALDLDQRRRTIAPRVLPPSFVGRAREIEKIGDALSLSADGHGQFMRIAGHRGAGKTWLIQQSGVKGEAIVQLGMAPVGGTFVADGPWRHGLRELYSDLLSVLRTRHSDKELTQLLGPSTGQLLFVLGIDFEPKASAARSGPSNAPASINQDAILHFAIRLIRLAAEERRLFIVLEDIHNAGDLELELLARCAELVHDLPVFIAATYRTDALSERTREWLRKIDSTGAPEPLLVEPLTDGEIRELLAAMLAPSIDLEPEFVASVIATSDGLPSKAVQTVQTWWSGGTLRVKDGSWQFEAQDARSGELSRLAVENLSADIFELLAAVSLLQSSHPEDVIAATLRDSSPATKPGLVDGFELLPRLRDLVNKGLLRENDGGFELAPDVEETTVINKLAPEKLARLHVGAAEALLAHYNDTLENHLFRIATHFKAAGDDMRACEHFVAAARHADRIFANQRTREAYTRALGSANAPAQLYEIHVELGEFHTRIGEYSDALTCIEQAREQLKKLTESLNEENLSLRRIDLLDKIGGVLQLQGDYSAALEKFSACRDAAGNRREVEARALWRIGGIRLDLGESDAARTFLEQSLALYEEIDDATQLTRVHGQLGIVEKVSGHVDHAIERFERAFEYAGRAGQELAAATALYNLGNIHRSLGRDDLAIDCLQRSIKNRERAGDRAGLAKTLNGLAQVYQYRGEFENSVQRTENSRNIFREIGDVKGILITQCNLGDSLRLIGSFDRARKILEGNLQLAETQGMPAVIFPTLCNLGNLDIDLGEYERALDPLLRCLGSLPDGKLLPFRLGALIAKAAVHLQLQNYESADDTLEECKGVMEDVSSREKMGELATLQVRRELAHGDPERAMEIGRELMSQAESGVERFGRALLRRELGRAFREIGPEWADQTEKYLQIALTEFREMSSPQNIAATEIDLAVYWDLLGEEEEARQHYERGEREFKRIGAARRLTESNYRSPS